MCKLFLISDYKPFLVIPAPRSRGILGGLADPFAGLYDSYVADYVTNQYRSSSWFKIWYCIERYGMVQYGMGWYSMVWLDHPSLQGLCGGLHRRHTKGRVWGKRAGVV